MEEFIEVPIWVNFDANNPIGYVRIHKNYIKDFPEMTLSPAYYFSANKPPEKELSHFGLVNTINYIKALIKI